MFRSPPLSPIGIDIGSARIKCVQLALGEQPTIHACTNIPRLTEDPLPTPAEIARLSGVLRRHGFSGRSCACAIPVSRMLATAMELPSAAGGAPLDVIARHELARAAKIDAHAFEFDWWPLPSGARAGEGTHALGLGCRHEDAQAIVDAFSTVGLDVEFLAAPPAILAAAVTPMLAPPGELTGVLDLGHSAVSLLVLAGSVIVYQRTIPASGMRLIATAVGNQFGLDAIQSTQALATCGMLQPENAGPDLRAIIGPRIDALADEVKAAAAYASRRFNAPLSRVLLVGASAAMPGLAARLADRALATALVASPEALNILSPEDSPIRPGPESILALGLALAPTLEEAMS